MSNNIEVVYNHDKKRLTILKDGKPVGGYCGPIATEMAKKIVYNNAKVEVKDDLVQIGN